MSFPVLALVSRTPASLHIYADHSVLNGPPANVVVEGVRFDGLLFEFIAGTTGNINQHCAVSDSFIRGKDVDQIFGLGAI